MTTLVFSGVDANVTRTPRRENANPPQEQSARPLIINLHVYDPALLNAEPACMGLHISRMRGARRACPLGTTLK